MYDTTRLLLLAATLSVFLACLPSLGQCYILYEEEFGDDDDTDVAVAEEDTDADFKRGYRDHVVAEPVPRSLVGANALSKYLQLLASRRLVNDPQMAKRQVNVGLRLISFDTLRNRLEESAASRRGARARHNKEHMARVGRRR